tara:strand:- start:128 stop:2119 length:1992 start_codon:yes stop_codon:yes gene_type:complete
MSKKNLNFKYLNYIDALRAISVVLVIFFHLNPEYFSLGYLGVDIFFVISGYVITNSIYEQQISKNKNIFFFYVRRIKRIFPILLLVIFSFIFFYIILSPLSGKTNFILGSAASSLVGLSNLYFINNDINYFLSDGINPLLHTWSLGIEEQFYLIYPIFIIFTYKIFKKNIEKIFSCIFLFSITSFLIYYLNEGIIGSFYSPLSRFWELGLGCLAFFYPSITKNKKNIFNFILIVIIIYTLSNFQNEKMIQNSNLLATLASFILIVNLRRVESAKFFLIIQKTYLPYLGKLSYSLYLWHLPVLYFCEIYFSGSSLYIVFFTTSLSLSVCSFHFYENPLRKSQIMDFLTIRLLKYLPIILILLFIIVNFGIKKIDKVKILKDLKEYNYPEKKLKNYLTRLDFGYLSKLTAECNSANNLYHCQKNKDYNKSLYITGDSHADHFIIGIDNINFIDSYFFNNFAQCKIILSSFYNIDKSGNRSFCKKMFDGNYEKIIINKLKKFDNSTIIISLRLSTYLKSNWKIIDKDQVNKLKIIKENYQKFINLFPKANILLITTVPESKIHTEKCIFNEFFRKKIDQSIFYKCHFKKTDDKERYDLIKKTLSEISSKNNNVLIYDPYPLLCPGKICHNFNTKNNFFMLHDKDHLSIEASKFISKDLSSFLEKNF